MEIVTGAVIASNDQQGGCTVECLLRRRSVVDMGICGKDNERRTQPIHELHTWIIQTNGFVVDCTVVLVTVIYSGKGIDGTVLLVQQYNRASNIVCNPPDRATSPIPLGI